MQTILRRAAELPDGRTIPPLYVRKNDPQGTTVTLGFWDDDKGFVVVGQEVSGDFAPMLAAAPSLYFMLVEQSQRMHSFAAHSGPSFRDCEMTICERAARTLLGADRVELD